MMQGSEATTHGIWGVTGLTPLSSFPGWGAGQVAGTQSVAVGMDTVTPRLTAQGWVALLPCVALG